MKKTLKRMVCGVLAMATAVSALCTSAFAVDTTVDPNGLKTSDILDDMGMGWNLGNSLDACGGGNTLSAETSWGNPKTTQAMIDAIKKQGFNTVRIPVTWGQHTSGDDYTINADWMARVKEVVDYCYNDDMYVILNIHHDTSDNNVNYYYPDSDNYDRSEEYVTAIWSQIAEEFSSYDDHLVFETLNEPRLVGTDFEWQGGSSAAVVKDSRQCITKLNQAAVNTIRANDANTDRLIMCPGYAASLDGAVSSDYVLPTDISGNKNRVLVSVHAYSPYNFAMNAGGSANYNSGVKKELTAIFDTLKSKFTSKGIGVVIGEMGATNKQNSSDRAEWAIDFTTMAKEQHIVCCVWDNNFFEEFDSKGNFKKNSEYFGVLNRKTLKFYDTTYTNALVKVYGPPSVADAVITVSTQTYTGKAIIPSLTVKYGTTTLVKGTDYIATFSNNTNVGTATFKITGMGNYKGVKLGIFEIKKNVSSLKFTAVSDQVWTGKAISPSFTIKDGTKTLVKGTDYTITYSSNKNVGTAKAVITLKGNYTGSKTISFKIIPKKQTLKTLTGLKNAVRITYSGHSVATGYQIKYSTKSDMSNAKTIWVTKKTSTLKTIKGLKSGTKYYFTVRTYTTVNGTKIAGAWASKHTAVAK